MSVKAAAGLSREATDCELRSLEKRSEEECRRIKKAEGQIYDAYRRYSEKSLSGSAYKRIKEQGLKRMALCQKNIERIEGGKALRLTQAQIGLPEVKKTKRRTRTAAIWPGHFLTELLYTEKKE